MASYHIVTGQEAIHSTSSSILRESEPRADRSRTSEDLLRKLATTAGPQEAIIQAKLF